MSSFLFPYLISILYNIKKETLKMKLEIILEASEEGGYTAIVPSLPGCISEGDTREEALKNIREAIELYLEPVDGDKSFAPDFDLNYLGNTYEQTDFDSER